MGSCFGKVSRVPVQVTDTRLVRVGLAYSALPRLIHAQARHILTSPTPIRRGIDLLPYQLITNRMVRHDLDRLHFPDRYDQARGAECPTAIHPSRGPRRGDSYFLASMGRNPGG
jgi:hypothetical protein